MFNLSFEEQPNLERFRKRVTETPFTMLIATKTKEVTIIKFAIQPVLRIF